MGFGKEEALLFDCWPLNTDVRIPFGDRREVTLELPTGNGTVDAVVRYHDWMKTKVDVLTLSQRF